jgi:hypothetical protein
MIDAMKQAQELLKESRKIIRASGSRHLAKDWDIRTTNHLAKVEAELRRLHEVNQELVEALEEMINWEVRNLINWDNTAHKNAEAALAKARGME